MWCCEYSKIKSIKTKQTHIRGGSRVGAQGARLLFEIVFREGVGCFRKFSEELFSYIFLHITEVNIQITMSTISRILILLFTLTIQKKGYFWRGIKTSPRSQEFYRASGSEIPGSATRCWMGAAGLGLWSKHIPNSTLNTLNFLYTFFEHLRHCIVTYVRRNYFLFSLCEHFHCEKI